MKQRIMTTMDSTPYQSLRGFTLIELLIVVSIIAILAAIAIPSLDKYLAKSRRNEGRSLLMQISAKQEQFFLNNRSYSDDFTQLGTISGTVTADKVTSEKGYYEVTIVRPTLYTYTLTATPISSQAGDVCTTLTIDQDGSKDFTPDTAVGCW